MTQSGSENPIGVFDSGVGGLTILRAVRQELPCENLTYVADAAYVPYGQKSPGQIRDRAMAIGGFLLQQGAKVIVIACNTATAVAIDMLRARLPIPVVGVEPAVKPAVSASRSGVVGILATPATLASERYRNLIERFGSGIRIVAQPCAGVAVIENGTAVAKEVARQLTLRGSARSNGTGSEIFWSSGPTQQLQPLLIDLWAPHARLQSLHEFQINAGRDFNAAP